MKMLLEKGLKGYYSLKAKTIESVKGIDVKYIYIYKRVKNNSKNFVLRN